MKPVARTFMTSDTFVLIAIRSESVLRMLRTIDPSHVDARYGELGRRVADVETTLVLACFETNSLRRDGEKPQAVFQNRL